MKEQIIQLRASGKSYREIKKILGCSASVISYHCGKGQKEKAEERRRKYTKTLNAILKRKKDNFNFSNGNRICNGKRVASEFSAEDFKKKITDDPKCYLTGRFIDLYKPKMYHCDHVTPVSKGGSCKLENLGLTCKQANMAKNDMSIDEFLQLCKEVLEYHGYNVVKMDSQPSRVSELPRKQIVP